MTATHHIDLKTVLQERVSGVYGDLVTRSTGKAVRGGVEEELATMEGEAVVVIDFGTVRILDISCADEIVGKLLMARQSARYYLLQGVNDAHCDAIEQVLKRHQLAVVARDREGRVQVLGHVEKAARTVFATLSDTGAADLDEIAARLSWPRATTQEALEELLSHQLVQLASNRYMPLSA